MSAFDQVLQRARKVKRLGAHRALISCPAAGHEDRHPSVTVTETPDGTVLMNCRSRGCDFAAMVDGLGMELKDFFPPRLDFAGDFRPPLRRETPAGDILCGTADEICYALLVVHDLHTFIVTGGQEGNWPDGTTGERLGIAFDRIRAAASEATGSLIDVEKERDEILKAARLTPEEEQDLDRLRDHGVSLQQQKRIS